jgi:pimeloyl-ACP methyl ester carboxylesterase
MRKSFRYLLWIFGLTATLAAGFTVWGLTPSQPMPEALTALQSDNQVIIQAANWLEFKPVEGQLDTGFIIYPGGHVDYRAYAPAAKGIAARGNLVVIVPMPLNLAVMDPDAALKVMAAYPEIKHWSIGGHSLGGAMAAHFIFQNPGVVDGLVLWASYSASNEDLSQSGIRVISISGTRDGLSTPEKIADSRPRLPEDTTWVGIEGGNHAQFGWYGDQPGDNAAEISHQDQQGQVIAATVQFLALMKDQ